MAALKQQHDDVVHRLQVEHTALSRQQLSDFEARMDVCGVAFFHSYSDVA